MRKILSVFFLFGTLLSFSTKAQSVRLSENPETFISEIKTLMATGNNSIAIASGNKFESYWTSKFNSKQKTALIATTRKMGIRGYKMPQYYFFFTVLDKVIDQEKFSDEKLDNLIAIIQKFVDVYDMKTSTKMLEGLKDFVEKRQLYASNYNRLYALGGSFDFKFIETKGDATAAQQPATAITPATAAPAEDPKLLDGWDTPNTPDSAPPVLNKITFNEKKPMPELGGLTIKLDNTDLILATASDSVFLKGTSGAVSLKDGVYVGKGGLFTWESAGLPQISVVFTDYTFEIRNPKVAADDVTLTYTDRLTAPVKGVFEYRSVKRAKNAKPAYPRFMSYESNAFIKNIDANIEYRGGFSMLGSRIFSSSVQNQYSNITVKKGGTVAFKANSTRFELGESLVSAQIANFVTYIGADSIYHPAVRFNYNPKDFSLKLNRINAGAYKETTFSDSYHQLNIKCDAMYWNLNDGKMDFQIVSAKSQIPAIFESFDFYDAQRVTGLSTGLGFNPLVVVGNYTQKNNKLSFGLDEIATFNKVPAEKIKGGLSIAIEQGFVDYTPSFDTYKLTVKGQHYLAALAGKKDFDEFIIPSLYNSKDSTSNATLNLNDKTLTIRGVRRFNVSDSLKAYVLPYDQILKVGKNRALTFNGQFRAKNYRFSGKELLFDYEKYTLALPKIDSITLIPKEGYRKGSRREIGGQVRYENPGIVYLNSPDNKSGKKYLPQYPKLKIDQGVIVYFDDASHGSRRYDKEVRFEVPKIDIDSLNTTDLAYQGTFYSGTIFKPFKETLRVMPDTTLGFSHKVPNGKYNVFGDEAAVKFASPLVMDSRGLHSEGDLTHLAATLNAKEIYFMADSLTATGQMGKVTETTRQGSYFPQVEIKDYALTWKPKVDSMLIASKEGFNFYAGTSSLKGKIVVRTGGLFGLGKLIRTDSETASDDFKFNKDGFIADKSQLNVKSAVAGAKSVLLGKNVNVNFNVTKNIVDIAINEGNFNDSTSSSFDFPYTAYKTNINRAEWNIKNKKISMKGDVEKSIFTSTNKAQEGLAFNGNTAIYDIDQMTFNIGGIPFIKSADAKIMPDKGQVSIRRDANMLPFKNARLTIDTLNGYHNLTNGNIQIVSKNSFTGDASYQFVNVRKDTFNIKMSDFELREVVADADKKAKEKNLSTFAHATVKERDSLFLSPKILYQGEIAMLAPTKNLTLNGFVIPVLKKYPKLGGYWIPYKGDKSEEITINVDKNLRSNESFLFAGLHFRTTTSTNGLYPTFLSAKETDEDQDVFVANGVFKRDEPNKLFSITPEGGKIIASNRYEILDDKGIINLEGKFNLLDSKLAQYVQTTGFAKVRLDTAKHEFNTMMLMNFPISQPLLANMSTKIVKTNLDLGVNEAAVELNSPEFISKVAHVVGDKDIEDYKAKSAREYVPLFKFSPKFLNTIVFSDLQLMWSPKQNAYRSVGKLGISNIGEADINAKVDGYVEIKKNPITGDEVYIFLELSSENWYYMGYKEGEMGVVSSDDAFNALVGAKGDKKGTKDYQVIPIDLGEAMLFRKTFLETYRGIKPQVAGKKPADAKKLAEVPKEATQKKDDKKKKEEEKEGF